MSVQNWISQNPIKFIASIVAALAILMGALFAIEIGKGLIMVEGFKQSLSGITPAEPVHFVPPAPNH